MDEPTTKGDAMGRTGYRIVGPSGDTFATVYSRTEAKDARREFSKRYGARFVIRVVRTGDMRW